MIKSPLGVVLAAAAIVLAVSPEARKAVRKLAVKGAGVLLEISEQIKEGSSGPHAESNDRKETEQSMV